MPSVKHMIAKRLNHLQAQRAAATTWREHARFITGTILFTTQAL